GAALIAVVFLDFLQFFDDQVLEHLVRSQDLQVLGDTALDVGQLVDDLLLLHAGQALQLQLDDGLGLSLREFEASDETFARLLGTGGGADQFDNRVEVLQRLLETEQDMLALPGLAELIIGAPADDVNAVVDETPDAVDQPQLA